MTNEKLQDFFSERPQLSAFGFAKEAGVSPRLMAYILNNERRLTKRVSELIKPIVKKYGGDV